MEIIIAIMLGMFAHNELSQPEPEPVVETVLEPVIVIPEYQISDEPVLAKKTYFYDESKGYYITDLSSDSE